MTQLTAGMPAPQFSGNDQNGNTVKLSSFTGKKIVLYFYPKDDTPDALQRHAASGIIMRSS
jgi:thioredoxin-dependent peroxiredoxin